MLEQATGEGLCERAIPEDQVFLGEDADEETADIQDPDIIQTELTPQEISLIDAKIARLRQNLAHPSNRTTVKMLRSSAASVQVVQRAKLYRCHRCRRQFDVGLLSLLEALLVDLDGRAALLDRGEALLLHVSPGSPLVLVVNSLGHLVPN